MSNKEKYIKAFKSSLTLSDETFNEELKYNEIPEWDSIGHMTLISGIEDEFKISIETDDVINLSSFKEGIKILKKYNVEI